jgi:soluble cytochrome b562
VKTIRELLARDLNQKIEEIIKLDQLDEQAVHTELTEYIGTERIKEQYLTLLRAIAEAPAEPHEGVGIWISGFFGSGKSSFAKNLGYVLSNRKVLGKKASDLFKEQLDVSRISDLIDLINTKIPTEVVMFDVSVDRAVRRATERMTEVMYTVLLRELDYAEDYDVAELEMELEKEGKLDAFVKRCEKDYGDWRTVRKGAQKISRASAILHSLDTKTYPTSDAWSQSLRGKSADVTVAQLVQRTFDLTALRRPGKALAFIIDEVGQYVARSSDKILDLQAIVREFGKEGKNRIKAKKAIAPVWIVVTSQEKLDEVVAALDSKRVELAKLQDSFKYRIDMAPADIRDVASRRVLAKKAPAIPVLKKLYATSEGQLNAACRLQRTARKTEIKEDDFVQFYPYLPHFVELSIDIMSGIRLQPGAPRHLGGSNRTIIKQAYEMLVSERTALAAKPVGTLVTLDKIFELVEGNLSDLKRADIDAIRSRLDEPAKGYIWPSRVAKAICLLEFVRDLPRTEHNIAAVLVDEVGKPAPENEVQVALKQLIAADFVIQKDEGFELLTPTDKNWQKEKKGYLSPKPRDRNEIIREALRDIYAEPQLKTCRYKDLRNFRVGIVVDGNRVGDEGQIPLSICTADSPEQLAGKVTEIRDESRQDSHKNEIYWVFALTDEIDDLVARLYASRQMVNKYEQLRAQTTITNEENACLANEKNEVLRLQSQLRGKVIEVLQKGQGLFRGVTRDASSLGKSVGDIFKKLFDTVLPDLYPKLEMGARQLKGTESEELLKAANLNGLSQVFYGGEQGLNLVVKEGQRFVPNSSADIAKEILDYINREASYGNKDTRTGKALENHFGGLGYGWELDMIRLVLAVLFRAGTIEVTHAGKKFDTHTDPQSRVPFTSTTAFRSALFTPAKPLDLQTLTKAVESYEALTGETVDVDKNAIAAAFKHLAEEEKNLLLPVEAQAKANKLPVVKPIEDYRETMDNVLKGTADECVLILASEGKSLKEAKERIRKIRDTTNDKGLAIIRQGRLALSEMWPVLKARAEDGNLATAAESLKSLLVAETFYESLPDIKKSGNTLASAYGKLYAELHSKRAEQFAKGIEEIKGRPEWTTVSENLRTPLLSSLVTRACAECQTSEDSTVCARCNATANQIDSDVAALGGLMAGVMARIVELTTPKEKIQRVRLSDFFSGTLDSEEAVQKAVQRLREHLLKLIAEGAKIILE